MSEGGEYTDNLVTFLELIWGQGFMAPGGPDLVRDTVAGLDLQGKRVLDIGSGLGGPDIVLAQMGAKVVGLDIEAPVIERARKLVAEKGLSDRISFKLTKPGPLPFADERSVVQTRFATTTLALLRAHLGEDLGGAIADARQAVAAPLPFDPAGTEQVTFLGQGWTVGLAQEAALKCREAAGLWTEAYQAMEYRHGPIAIAAPGRAVWAFGAVPEGLVEQTTATGASFRRVPSDPMADLILAQRFAVAAADARHRDPDHPTHLTRSVILP